MNKLYSKEIFRKMNKNGVSRGYYHFFVLWGNDDTIMDITKTVFFRNENKLRYSEKFNAIIEYTPEDVLNGFKTWMSDCGVKYCGGL